MTVSHRGDSRRFPENTLEAFQAAIESKVDFIECDIHETADGCFVIYHDETIQGHEVKQMTTDEISHLLLAERFHIPTLQETLALCEGRVGLFLEIKMLKSFDRFAEIIRSFQFPSDKIGIISLENETLIRVSQVLPEIKRGLVIMTAVSDINTLLKQSRSEFVGIEYGQLSPELVHRVREAKVSVFVWNVPDKQAFEHALSLDVAGIIAGNTEIIRDWLH